MRFDLPHFMTAFITLAIAVSVVAVHFEGLNAFSRWLMRDPFVPRIRIAALILGQILLHTIEIWIFALGYIAICEVMQAGALIHSPFLDAEFIDLNLGDYVYFSAVVYSTLGFGDVVPIGPVRFLTGTEGVMGLVLITWSASFTFLEMQRHWGRG